METKSVDSMDSTTTMQSYHFTEESNKRLQNSHSIFLTGYDNMLDNVCHSCIVGDRNHVNGDDNYVLGMKNINVNGSRNDLVISYSTVQGNVNKVVGNNNIIRGDYNLIFGENCKVYGVGNICQSMTGTIVLYGRDNVTTLVSNYDYVASPVRDMAIERYNRLVQVEIFRRQQQEQQHQLLVKLRQQQIRQQQEHLLMQQQQQEQMRQLQELHMFSQQRRTRVLLQPPQAVKIDLTGSSGQTTHLPRAEKDEPVDEMESEAQACRICYERKKQCCAFPCRHLAFCHTCSLTLMKNQQPQCPICNAKVDRFEWFHLS